MYTWSWCWLGMLTVVLWERFHSPSKSNDTLTYEHRRGSIEVQIDIFFYSFCCLRILQAMYACSTTFLKLNSTYSITWSHHYLWLHSLAVYTSHWHMEHRLHLCWSSNREATFPWKKCCSPIGLDDRSAWDTFVRHNLSGSQIIHLSVIWLWCSKFELFD